MKVTLRHFTPLYIAAESIRECWQSQGKSDTCKHDSDSDPIIHDGWIECRDCGEDIEEEIVCGEADKALIDRIGNKFKHASTLEHLNYNFHIEGISRALLQELARHRIASLSVKSTRYTLKELKEEDEFSFISGRDNLYKRSSKYLVFTPSKEVNIASIQALEKLRKILLSGEANDVAKYCLPESYKTSLSWTINARSLQNFLALRSSKAALWEIRDLAQAVSDALPDDHKYLFENCVKESTDVTISKEEYDKLQEFKYMYESCSE